jgi:hypothetical protein
MRSGISSLATFAAWASLALIVFAASLAGAVAAFSRSLPLQPLHLLARGAHGVRRNCGNRLGRAECDLRDSGGRLSGGICDLLEFSVH